MIGLERQPCDEGVVRSGGPAVDCSARTRNWVLAATILGSSIAFINGSVVNVALPAMQEAFAASTRDVQWIVNGYALLLAALILVGGSAGDRYGLRRIFVTGILLFSAASVGCALAPRLAALLTARALQGVGGALLVPASLAILARTFTQEERGKAMGTWAGFAGLTSAAGPLLGGWLVDLLSWRWVFLVALPFAGAALGITLLRMPELPVEDRRSRLDLPGASSATLGLGALTYGLIEVSRLGLGHPVVVGSLVAGALLLVLFVRVESGRRDEAMMPLALFRSTTFSGANLLTFLLYFALGGALFFLPFNLIQVQGYSAAEAGAAFLPFTLLMGGLSRWSGGLVARFGAKKPLVAGPLVAAAGFVLFALPGIGGSYVETFLPAMSVLGLGMAISVAPLTTVVMTAVADDRAGIASGINNAASRVAWLLAVAVLGALAVGSFGRQLDRRLADLALPAEIVEAVAAERDKLAAASIPAGVSEAQRAALAAAIDSSFVTSFRLVMGVACALAIASSLAAALMIRAQEIES